MHKNPNSTVKNEHKLSFTANWMKWPKMRIKNYTEIFCDRISGDENIRRTTHTHTHTHTQTLALIQSYEFVRMRPFSVVQPPVRACSIQYWNEISEKGCLRPPEHSESAHTHTHSHSGRHSSGSRTHTLAFINFWTVFAMCISSLSLIDGTQFPSVRFMFCVKRERRTRCAIVPRQFGDVTSRRCC